MKPKSALVFFILTIGSICFLLFHFAPVFQNPNNILFAPGGDGIKNYYTPGYYIKYDEGCWFKGMNYPFGENIVYTDNQPLLSFLLGELNDCGLPAGQHIFGILNLLMLLSFIPAVFFLYLIMRRFLIPVWIAIIAAISIASLSPQFERLTGHYALSYLFVVPMIWWGILKIFEQKNVYIVGALWIFVVTSLAFIHLYYLAIAVLFLLVYTFVWVFQQYKDKRALKYGLYAISLALIPLIFVKCWLWMFDPVNDRPPNPYGILSYTTSIESVFLPNYSMIRQFLSNFFRVGTPNWEGLAYIGFPGLMGLGISIVHLMKRIYNQKFQRLLKPVMPEGLGQSLWAGFIILVFAMGILYQLGLSLLTDLIPALRQFRSIGRFAWIFYYVFTVYSVYIFYVTVRHGAIKLPNGKPWLYIGLCLILGIWLFEGSLLVKSKTDYIYRMNQDPSQNAFLEQADYDTILQQNGFSKQDFQAIFPLPFFMIGSEKIQIDRNPASNYHAMKLSYHTGLPIAATMLSRTSFSQTLQITQLLSSPHIEKQLLPELNDEPFLILKTGPLLAEEKRLIRQASLIEKKEDFSLWKLEVDAFRNNQDDVLASFTQKKDSMYKGPWYYSYTTKPDYLHCQHFDEDGDVEQRQLFIGNEYLA